MSPKNLRPHSLINGVRLGVLVMLVGLAHAVEQRVPENDPDLPQPFAFDAQALNNLRTHSPFNRVVSLADTYKLTGVAYVNGKPMATFVNKDTKQHFVVSEETNSLGMTLTEAHLSDDPEKTEVRVMIGPEEVVMHYSEVSAAPENSSNGRINSSSGKQLGGSSTARSQAGSSAGIDTASLLGDQGKEMLNALSPENREKLTSIITASAAKHPERTQEQLASTAQKIYAKMRSSETKATTKAPTGGTPKPPKSEKPKKR
ncbi:MAG: hypothetical protein JNM99_09340 [Verrucomicrobiaceae bacterium]|nr:hypothetical protein [Verrucomicrobiaceae bacterium]